LFQGRLISRHSFFSTVHNGTSERRISMHIIGLDLGTSTLCLNVLEVESGDVLLTRRVPHPFLAGTWQQDPEDIYARVIELLKDMPAYQPAALGISTQMHGILYIDADGNAVSPFYTWKDTAAESSYQGTTFRQYFARKTGLSLADGYGTLTHFVCQERGLIPPTAAGFTDLGNYIAMRLTHTSSFFTSPTLAASFGAYDAVRNRFQLERLKQAGIETSYFPPVRLENNPAGTWNGALVYPALGDNQASFLAAVPHPEEDLSITVGTGAQISLWSREDLSVPASLDLRPFPFGGQLLVGASLNGGKVYEQLAAFMQEIVQTATAQDIDGYALLERLGEMQKETTLQCVPNLYGSRNPDRDDFSGFRNLRADNFHPGDLVRAYVRGMAAELYALYQDFPKAVRASRKRIAASGNGIRRNRLLQEELVRTFQLPLAFSPYEEEAAAGAALYALRLLQSSNAQ
jgi:sedoheptulokinase